MPGLHGKRGAGFQDVTSRNGERDEAAPSDDHWDAQIVIVHIQLACRQPVLAQVEAVIRGDENVPVAARRIASRESRARPASTRSVGSRRLEHAELLQRPVHALNRIVDREQRPPPIAKQLVNDGALLLRDGLLLRDEPVVV